MAPSLPGSVITELPAFRLEIQGLARGKGRPRFVRQTGRTYTDTLTQSAEQRIQGEWIAAGRPYLDGAIQLHVTVYLARPQGHYKRDGSLTTEGQRHVFPTRKPDWDNLGKLVADALSGLAYKDDKQIVTATVEKRWAMRGQPERTIIGAVTVAAESAA